MTPNNPALAPEFEEWQVECSKLKKRAIQLFKTRQWADCTFRFERSETSPGGTVKAHKLFLAMASPTFDAQFFRSEDKPDVVDIEDISMSTFNEMLRYLYTDQIDMFSIQNAIDMYYAAKKYFLAYLKKHCVMFLSDELCPSNVCQVYEFSCFFDEHALQEKCLQLMRDKTLEVIRGGGFILAKLQTVQTLISMDPLEIISEIDLFKALLRYARKGNFVAEAAKNGMLDAPEAPDEDSEGSTTDCSVVSGEENDDADKSVNDNSQKAKIYALKKKLSLLKAEVKKVCRERRDEGERTVARKLLRSSVEKIRFLTMTPREFAECKNIELLLKKDEIIAISLNIASLDCAMEMPPGFTKCLLPRNQKNKNVSTGVIRFTVNNLRMARKYTSIVFCAKNIPWKVRVELSFKRTKDDVPKQTLRVCIDCFIDASSWTCQAEYTIRTIPTATMTQCCILNVKDKHTFSDKEDTITHTYPWYIVRNQHGTLMNDNVIFEITVTPSEPQIHSVPPAFKGASTLEEPSTSRALLKYITGCKGQLPENFNHELSSSS